MSAHVPCIILRKKHGEYTVVVHSTNQVSVRAKKSDPNKRNVHNVQNNVEVPFSQTAYQQLQYGRRRHAYFLDPYRHFCLDASECKQGVCKRDSGGPVTVPGASGEPVQIRVISYTPPYYCSKFLDVAMNIARYIEWIQKETKGAAQVTTELQ